jgi:hypothetical protein
MIVMPYCNSDELIQMTQNPWILGLLAASIYHYYFQYPNQAAMFTTLRALVFANVMSAAWLSGSLSNTGTLMFLKHLAVFNFVMVVMFRSLTNRSNCSHSS